MRLFFYILPLLFLGCSSSTSTEDINETSDNNWFFWSTDWHPSQNKIAVGGSNDSYMKIIDTENFTEIKSLPYKGTITKVSWHPTKNKLAFSVQDGKSKSGILDIENDSLTELENITMDGARAIGWNAEGELLAVGDNEGYLTFFDQQGRLIRKINTEQKGLMSLDWHPKENLLVTVGEHITLYDFDADSLVHINDRKEDILMLSVAWHPSGEFFATGDYGDFIVHYPPLLQYWTKEGERLNQLSGSKAEYRNIKWSPDGEFLATASEKIRIWNQNGEIVREKEVEDLLWGIDWNKDGSSLVATDEKGRIFFWDIELNLVKKLQH